jgi:prolyl-tRNA editing enzyme YbaK/EbsC (Cys-tRNA(Pro) deacylase)
VVAETTGGVSPVGWLQPTTIIIYETLNDYDIVWAGHPHAVFPTNFELLIAATGAKTMHVADQ